MASTVGAKNPYRFKGYRYDSEAGLYYLQSRYYSPEWSRFINSDNTSILQLEPESLLSSNLFTYCDNNPVNLSDPTGYYAWYDFYRSRWFISNLINNLLGLLIGTSVFGNAAKYCRNKATAAGVAAAAEGVSRVIRSQLLKYGIQYTIASYISNGFLIGFTLLMWAWNPGEVLFDFLDARDRIPNSKYLDY